MWAIVTYYDVSTSERRQVDPAMIDSHSQGI